MGGTGKSPLMVRSFAPTTHSDCLSTVTCYLQRMHLIENIPLCRVNRIIGSYENNRLKRKYLCLQEAKLLILEEIWFKSIEIHGQGVLRDLNLKELEFKIFSKKYKSDPFK
ncbi:hypothetical protein SUGI_0801290 [Cryptomeria japonica]|nr:hypothetical protein SUGI_0801290 [Cryptomeria japonica]